MLSRLCCAVCIYCLLAAGASFVCAVTLETVLVGNPGNLNDSTGYGAVDYYYYIGQYEVSVAQYVEFLNAVGATDTYYLYHLDMKIQRNGTSGSYTYSAVPGWENRPINFVSWGDAARFANWLHNGQPCGAQDLTTTEDGAYFLNGALTRSALMAVVRETNWNWAIASENEWYKAAYHMSDYGIVGNYWSYPTASHVVPGNVFNPDPGNNANYYKAGFTIGSPYYLSEVGLFNNSPSSYGTFDQGGNVWEWNEAVRDVGFSRGFRGGSYNDGDGYMGKWYRGDFGRGEPTLEAFYLGFRVSMSPSALNPADIDANSTVDIGDLAILCRDWLLEDEAIPAKPNGDIDNNSIVNLLDLRILANNWAAN